MEEDRDTLQTGADFPEEDTPAPRLEPALVQRAMEGDNQAFSILFHSTYRMVVMTVRRYLSEEQALYDAVQETYLKAYLHLDSLRTPEAFCSWLRQIARNSAIALQQKQDRDRALFLPYDETDRLHTEEDRSAEQDIRLDIRTLLNGLPSEQEELLVMVYYDGMKLSEIARIQNTPYSTVSSRFQKARRELKRRMQEQGIRRPVYGGSFLAMTAAAMRDMIGTNLLSAAVAQQILDSVLEKAEDTRPIDTVTLLLASRRRNAAVLRIAALVTALAVGASCLTVWVLQSVESSPRLPVVGGIVSTDGSTSAVVHTTAATSPKPSATPSVPIEDISLPETASNSSGTVGTEDSSFPESTLGHADESVSDMPSNPTATPPLTGPAHTSTGRTTGRDSTRPTLTRPTASSSTASPSTASSTIASSPTAGTKPAGPPAFVPDYAPGEENTVGNRADNLIDGFVARQGNWVYFAEGNCYRYLMKATADGRNKQLIATSDTGFYRLNVLGDWIYYTSDGIYRIRTDGTGRELLSTMNAWRLLVAGDDAWFYVEGQSGTLYHMDIPSRRVTALEENVNTSGQFGSMAVVGDRLLYRTAGEVIARDLRTGYKRTLADNLYADTEFLLDGTTIYYCSGNALYARNCADNSAPRRIDTVSFSAIGEPVAICNGWLIDVKSHTYYARNLQDGKTHRLSIPHAYSIYSFPDGYIYYYTAEFRLCRVRPDGTGYQSYG